MYIFKNSTVNEFFLLAIVMTITAVLYTMLTAFEFGFSVETLWYGKTFFGFSSRHCLIIFCSFMVFMFFGIKEFFKNYTNVLSNIFIAISGMILLLVLFDLTLISGK